MRAYFVISMILSSLFGAACGKPFNCPTTTPAEGSSCSERSFVCESGGGDHQRCSTISTCVNADDATWDNTTTPMCTMTNDSTCAVDYNSVPVATNCPTQGITCDYTQGRCGCVACGPSGLNWVCRAWTEDIDPSCPSERPALGSPCTTPNLVCRYNNNCTVSFGPDIQCFSERWQPITGGAGTCSMPTCGISP